MYAWLCYVERGNESRVETETTVKPRFPIANLRTSVRNLFITSLS